MSLFDGYIVNQEIITLIKIYPDFVRLYKYVNPFYVKRYDYDPYQSSKPKKKKAFKDPEESDNSSLKRAKTRFMDTALCNDFDLYPTFTFAKDRFNVDAKKRQMAYWLNNQRILHGNFKYLIVPEYHKDGKALHFHALFSGYKGHLKTSGIFKKGREVFNVTSYQAGHTEAYKIDNLEKTVGYIAKYISKDMPKFKGKQRYWCSNGLKRPLKIINPLLTDQDRLLFKLSYSDKEKEIFEFRGQLTDADIARIADYGKRRYDDLQVAER